MQEGVAVIPPTAADPARACAVGVGDPLMGVGDPLMGVGDLCMGLGYLMGVGDPLMGISDQLMGMGDPLTPLTLIPILSSVIDKGLV